MALPTPTPTGPYAIPNGQFTSDANGWTLETSGSSTISWSATGGRSDAGCVKFDGVGTANDGSATLTASVPVVVGQSITASAWIKLSAGTPGSSAQIALLWTDHNDAFLSSSPGGQVNIISNGGSKTIRCKNRCKLCPYLY